MTKAELEKEAKRLHTRIEVLKNDLQATQKERDELHDFYGDQIEEQKKDFDRYNDYAMSISLVRKNDELNRKVEQLQNDLEWYQNREDSKAMEYIGKLERHIVQLSMSNNQ